MIRKVILFLFFLSIVMSGNGQKYVFLRSSKKLEYKKGSDWIIAQENTVLNHDTYVKCKTNFDVKDLSNKKHLCSATTLAAPLYTVLDKYKKIRQNDGYVWVKDGNIYDAARELNESQARSVTDSLNVHYLIVDIHDFDDSAWGKIGLPNVDARSLENALKKHFIPNNKYILSYSKVLDNLQNTSADSVKSSLNELVETVGEDTEDVVVVYLSSHGTRSKTGKFCLITSDTSIDDFNRSIDSYVSEDDIINCVRELALKNAKTLIFIDACYAGTIIRNLSKDDEILKRNVAFFTSTANDLSAFQDRDGSPFAVAITRAMSGDEQFYFRKDDNVVTPQSLDVYIRESVNKKHTGQDPQSIRGLEMSPKTPLWTISEINPKSYLSDLKYQASNNNTDALIELGNYFNNGNEEFDIPINADSAFHYYSKAFDIGDKRATVPLAMCYYYGTGVKQDYKEAFDLFSIGEIEEDDIACYYLAVYYTKGIIVKKSKKEALRKMKKIKNPMSLDIGLACEREGVPIKGIMQKDGEYLQNVMIINPDSKTKHIAATIGINLDTKKEYVIGITRTVSDKPVYDFKAEEGDSHAQAMMGRSFLFGIDKPRNYEMAVKWLNKSAAQDNGDAFYYLYVCFSHGFGVAEDKGKAMSYLERAVNKNIPNAWIEMGNHYFYGDNSVKADDKEAFILWHKAAQKGHPVGQYKVGLCYKYGIGVEPNESSAKDWLLKSAKNKKYGDETGYASAQYELGKYYLSYQNYQDAYKWLNKAKMQGNSNAKKLLLKYYYSNGEVKKQNN